MTIYKRILLAADLDPSHDTYTTQRAVEFAKECNAILYVVHAIEGISHYDAIVFGIKNIPEAEILLKENTKKLMDEFEGKYGIFPEQLIVEKGSPKTVIIEQAKKLNIDLIIVGSHSQPGISSILGSTANAILNNAHCDVLTIFMKE